MSLFWTLVSDMWVWGLVATGGFIIAVSIMILGGSKPKGKNEILSEVKAMMGAYAIAVPIFYVIITLVITGAHFIEIRSNMNYSAYDFTLYEQTQFELSRLETRSISEVDKITRRMARVNEDIERAKAYSVNDKYQELHTDSLFQFAALPLLEIPSDDN
jgi:hypothetical protein